MVKIPKFSGNLLLGVGLVAAAFFLTREIRGAGQDLAKFGEGFKPFEDFKLPDITFPDIKFPDFPEFKFPEFKFPDIFGDLFPKVDPDLSSRAGDVIPVGDGTTITIPEETKIDPDTGVVTSPTPPILDLGEAARKRAAEALAAGRLRAAELARLDRLAAEAEARLAAIPPSEDISGAEFAAARNAAEFRRRQREAELAAARPDVIPTIPRDTTIESLLPIDQQFRGGGPSFIGGTIRENPIDTLGEVIKFFPELTASQAADFLAETGGQILPSQVPLVDPDIRNIVIAGGDFPQQMQVETGVLSGLAGREAANIRAARFTCQMFGLNCELAESSMA